MGRGGEIVPKTEQVRKNVKALESTGFFIHRKWTINP